jgi:hypothetical protein
MRFRPLVALTLTDSWQLRETVELRRISAIKSGFRRISGTPAFSSETSYRNRPAPSVSCLRDVNARVDGPATPSRLSDSLQLIEPRTTFVRSAQSTFTGTQCEGRHPFLLMNADEPGGKSDTEITTNVAHLRATIHYLAGREILARPAFPQATGRRIISAENKTIRFLLRSRSADESRCHL